MTTKSVWERIADCDDFFEGLNDTLRKERAGATPTPAFQEHATPSSTLAEQLPTRLSASTPTPTETNSNE